MTVGSKPLRVGFLSAKDPSDAWEWSGTLSSMYRALVAQGCEIRHVGRSLLPWSARIPLLPRLLVKAGSRRRNVNDSVLETAVQQARALERELERASLDVLFAPAASTEIAFLKTTLPLAYLSDSTARLLLAYYPAEMRLPDPVKREREVCEQRAMDGASLLVFPTEWAGRSAIEHYGVNPNRVRLLPFGANIACSAQAAERLIADRNPSTSCRLLFVGKIWERKGGEIAIEALDALVSRGFDARLDICSEGPPGGIRHPRVRLTGPLDPRVPRQRAQLNDLFMQADILIVPSRAECFGVVFCEAAAYGIPALGTRTGGIPSIIHDSVTGFTFPLEARGAAYADRIADLLADPVRYRAMAAAARGTYDKTLNWTAWGRAMAQELHLLCEGRASKSPDRSR